MINGAILVSGEGKFVRRLLDTAFFREIEKLKIVGVVSSKSNGQALTRARNLHVPTFVVEEKLFPNGSSYGVAVLNKLRDIDTDFVVADGMSCVPACVAKHFAGRLLTVKLNPVGQSMEIVVYLADAKGGVSRVLADASVALEEGDTQEGFAARVYDLAESLLVDGVDVFCSEK